jgi:adenylate cyclase
MAHIPPLPPAAARQVLVRPLLIGMAAVLIAAALEFGWLHFLDAFENRLSDFFVRQHAAALAPDADIVIVDIDEKSFARMQDQAGKWPWPRAVHAELLTGIQAQKPRAVVFDVMFSEADSFRADSDRAFNLALEGAKNVYLPMLRLPQRDDVNGVRMAEVAPLLGIAQTPQAQPDARVALLPPLAVDPAHWLTGVVNFNEDPDGVGRRYWVAMPAYGWRIPSLPARVAADLGAALPAEDAIILHWRGPARSFQHISYSDLYEDFSRRARTRPQDE